MLSIDEILKNGFQGKVEEIKLYKPGQPILKAKSERADVLSQIYPLYRASTKLENWKRYIKWLKENRFKSSNLKVIEFKKTPVHLKTRSEKSFAIMLAHIPTKDLYFILSVGRDKANRRENFSGWVMGEVYKK